jgi:hypothetical protein
MPSLVLKKKHLSCNYFCIRESIAARSIRFKFVPTHMNYSNLLTKPLAKTLFHRFVKPILFHIPPNQHTDMHDIIPVNMPPPPGTTKSLSDENTQPQITPDMTLSPFNNILIIYPQLPLDLDSTGWVESNQYPILLQLHVPTLGSRSPAISVFSPRL